MCLVCMVPSPQVLIPTHKGLKNSRKQLPLLEDPITITLREKPPTPANSHPQEKSS